MVRGGGLQTVIRSASLPEALTLADTAQAAVTLPGATVQPFLSLPGQLAAVQQCAEQLGSLLGPWAEDACAALLAQGAAAQAALVPAVARALVSGVPAAGQGVLDDLAQEQLAAWRSKRRAALLAISDKLRHVSDITTALE